ncbi:TM1802 family CRISPR-associated protein [Cyclobacterium sp. 1_MG-2023]|uniref:TM1802 family CRISPR-associated protein n=1 Tax=Cyclobacterium sp. 1_MG-2023 TaxID=3062681 RepID=UPI0026E437F9|nr:TM1802 family CRISPR-associated protein [Cyclobacterium sp. 1_MG-2023]MDO6437054.1 TM1802 family CRISPR-associated protein [Cyclobacterium sp. 1_MG-2023]
MQDRTITDIGKLEFLRNKDLKPYELFTQEPYPNKVCKMLLIEFQQKEEKIFFKGIDVQNVNEQNYSKYAYRKGSARGGDITFTTKFGDLDKKLNTLINTQFPNLIELSEKEEPEKVYFFKDWMNSFIENYDRLKDELQITYDNQEKKDKLNSAFTLTMDIDGERRLLSDFKSVQQLISQNGIEGNYKKYGVTSKGENSECSVCHKPKPEIYGFGSPFKYSTVDKTGTVSGFFNQKNNWKNYPICENCAIGMELGKNYITKYLTRYFFGKSFYLIPKAVFPNDTEALSDALSLFSEVDYQIKNSEFISSSEDFLMERIGEINNNVFTLNLLFFEENPTTKAIKIKMMLEEIPPSRFRKLFIEVPKIINRNPLFKDIDYHYKKKQKQDLRFSFRLIKQFFEDNFYEMTYKIFMGRKINEKELNKRFMKVIRANYIKKVNNEGFVENGDLLIAKCFLLQSYFAELNLINYEN